MTLLKPGDTQAHTFWTIANGHKEAGDSLSQNLGKETSGKFKGVLWHPTAFCYLRSIELALKSYLLKRSAISSEDLKKKFGHRIDKLIKNAEATGLKDAMAGSNSLGIEERKQLLRASEAYAKKYFEYPDHTYPKPKPDLEFLKEVCGKIVSSTEKSFIKKSAR